MPTTPGPPKIPPAKSDERRPLLPCKLETIPPRLDTSTDRTLSKLLSNDPVGTAIASTLEPIAARPRSPLDGATDRRNGQSLGSRTGSRRRARRRGSADFSETEVARTTFDPLGLRRLARKRDGARRRSRTPACLPVRFRRRPRACRKAPRQNPTVPISRSTTGSTRRYRVRLSSPRSTLSTARPTGDDRATRPILRRWHSFRVLFLPCDCGLRLRPRRRRCWQGGGR